MGGRFVRSHPFLQVALSAIFFVSCSDPSVPKSDVQSTEVSDSDSGVPENPGSDDEPIEDLEEPLPEILAGVGIGPAQLGGTYGDLVAEIGPPDSMFEYYRVIFAVWLEYGIEVVFSSGVSAELSDNDPIVSVGTKLRDGYRGEVVPGMSRGDAEALIGECTDVVDGVHCYHPIGLYLGFDAEQNIQTVAIHPPYTVRNSPPEMELSEGGLR